MSTFELYKINFGRIFCSPKCLCVCIECVVCWVFSCNTMKHFLEDFCQSLPSDMEPSSFGPNPEVTECRRETLNVADLTDFFYQEVTEEALPVRTVVTRNRHLQEDQYADFLRASGLCLNIPNHPSVVGLAKIGISRDDLRFVAFVRAGRIAGALPELSSPQQFANKNGVVMPFRSYCKLLLFLKSDRWSAEKSALFGTNNLLRLDKYTKGKYAKTVHYLLDTVGSSLNLMVSVFPQKDKIKFVLHYNQSFAPELGRCVVSHEALELLAGSLDELVRSTSVLYPIKMTQLRFVLNRTAEAETSAVEAYEPQALHQISAQSQSLQQQQAEVNVFEDTRAKTFVLLASESKKKKKCC